MRASPRRRDTEQLRISDIAAQRVDIAMPAHVAAADGSVALSTTNIIFNTSSGVAANAGGTVRSFGKNRIRNNVIPGTIPFLVGAPRTGQQYE